MLLTGNLFGDILSDLGGRLHRLDRADGQRLARLAADRAHGTFGLYEPDRMAARPTSPGGGSPTRCAAVLFGLR